MDVRSLRGIYGDTDHFLVQTSTRKENTTSTIKWDIGKLREPTRIHKQAYKDHISNRLGTIEQ